MKTILAMSCLCASLPLLAMPQAKLEDTTSSANSTTLTNSKYQKSSLREIYLFGKPGRLYLGGSVGFSQLNTENRNQNINYYSGFLNDAYPNQNSNSNVGVVSIQGGYEFAGEKREIPAIAVGLGLYGMPSEYGHGGQLVETALGDAPSTLYNYRYNVDSTRLMAEAKFTWTVKHFTPFVDIGLGLAAVRLMNYNEVSTDNIGYPPLPPFKNQTNVNFAFQAGLGVGYELNFSQDNSELQHERISLGYRYVNLGDNNFGTRGSAYPYKLRLGNLSSQDIYLAFNHLF
jgi:opacity protein-like surface antigen